MSYYKTCFLWMVFTLIHVVYHNSNKRLSNWSSSAFWYIVFLELHQHGSLRPGSSTLRFLHLRFATSSIKFWKHVEGTKGTFLTELSVILPCMEVGWMFISVYFCLCCSISRNFPFIKEKSMQQKKHFRT